MAGLHLRLPQGETTECLIDDRCNGLFHGLREQRHGVGDAPGEDIRRTQGRGLPGEKERDVHFLTDAHSPFEQGKRPGQVALAEGQQTDTHEANVRLPG